MTYLEKVHSDVCGPIRPGTWSKALYFMSFIDDKTRWAEIALLTSRDQVYEEFKVWLTREEAQTDYKLKRFHSDNAKEYKSEQFQTTLREKGVIGTYSAPYTPSQNGTAEIFNRTIINKVRAMLYQSGLAKRY